MIHWATARREAPSSPTRMRCAPVVCLACDVPSRACALVYVRIHHVCARVHPRAPARLRQRPVFIFCLSVLLGLSRFTWWGLVAVGLALGGVTLLILSSLPGVVHGRSLAVEAATTCLGVALTVGSAFVWAGTDVYTQHLADHRFGLAHTTWRRPQLAPIVQMCALQGLLGAWTLLVCWVAIPLAAFFEGDPLLPSRDSLPPLATWPIIAASCASLVATNLSLSIAIACSSAFFMSIASLLSIPSAHALGAWRVPLRIAIVRRMLWPFSLRSLPHSAFALPPSRDRSGLRRRLLAARHRALCPGSRRCAVRGHGISGAQFVRGAAA